MYAVFSRISHLLFEPIAVCAFLGFWYAFLFSKRKSTLFWTILISVLFMLGWRIAGFSLMTSSRYYSILLFPALILTAFFCFQQESIFLRIVKTHWADSIPEYDKICRIIPWILILGLILASLIKVFHFTPNFGIINACETYINDCPGRDHIHTYEVNGTEQHRIRFYAKLHKPEEPDRLFTDSNIDIIDEWMSILHGKRNIFGTNYFFYIQKTNEKNTMPIADILEYGEWRELCHSSISPKKRVILYCYQPYCKNIELWEKEIPEMSPTNLCANGDFEQLLTGAEREKRIEHYKQNEVPDFYLGPERLYPKNWWVGAVKPVDGLSSTMDLTEKAPIAGKYSMEIKQNGVDIPGINSDWVPKQDYAFSGFIRGKENSTVIVYACCRGIDQKVTVIEKCVFAVDSGKTYRFSFQVSQDNIPEEVQYLYLYLQCSGHILLDNIEFIPNEAITKPIP